MGADLRLGDQCTTEEHRLTGCNGIGCWSKFAADEGRAAAWYVLRDQLLRLPNPGHARPRSGISRRPRPPCPQWPTDQLGWLRDHGQLLPRERRLPA
jgi:hypothetical protein